MTTKFVRPIAPRIHSHLRLLLLLPLACLLGCTLPYTPSPLSGNWQIQAGPSSLTPPTALTSPPTGIYLIGAMQIQGSQATAVFQTNAASGGAGIVNFSGSFDSTTSVLALSSTPAYLGVQLTLPANPTNLATGNMTVGCQPPPAGGATCTVIALLPAAGAEIAPLNGTYAGPLTESASSLTSPIPSGTVSLALTQSSTPNTSGQFPLTGTLTFNGGGCSASNSIGGFISGISFTNVIVTSLTSQAIPPPLPAVITAYTNPTASQITVSGLVFNPSPCSAVSSSSTTYAGTLTLQ
jgi:hypothetical protein